MATIPQYAKFNYFQLQVMLKERRLPSRGSKAMLIARLIDDDCYKPFPFLRLPGEIRNRIYKYVVAFEKPVKQSDVASAVDKRELPRHICEGDIQNQASIAQPVFLHTCSQIYREGRALFYGYREFKFCIWQEPGKKQGSKCFGKMFEWLDTLGVEMQLQIQTLEINLQCDRSADRKAYIWFVDNLHARLSDSATVVYRPISQMRARHDVACLWGIGKALYGRNPMRAPRYEHPNWVIRDPQSPENAGNVWASARNPLVYTPKKANVDRPSLTFGPDQGWFGGVADAEMS